MLSRRRPTAFQPTERAMEHGQSGDEHLLTQLEYLIDAAEEDGLIATAARLRAVHKLATAEIIEIQLFEPR